MKYVLLLSCLLFFGSCSRCSEQPPVKEEPSVTISGENEEDIFKNIFMNATVLNPSDEIIINEVPAADYDYRIESEYTPENELYEDH